MGNCSTSGIRNQVSAGMASLECDAMIIRRSVDPERPDPTMKNGAEFIEACPRRWRFQGCAFLAQKLG